jgi:hypothetical protein
MSAQPQRQEWNTQPLPQPQSREDHQAEEIVDEITKLRKQLRDVMGQVGTMKWGQQPDAD